MRLKGGRAKPAAAELAELVEPSWTVHALAPMRPVVPDRRFLEGEHLLVAVRSEDGDEVYGQGCIPLALVFGDAPLPFSCELTHKGDHTGTLAGFIHVLNAVGEGRQATISEEMDDPRAGSGPALASTPLSPEPAAPALPPRRSMHTAPSVDLGTSPDSATAAGVAAVASSGPDRQSSDSNVSGDSELPLPPLPRRREMLPLPVDIVPAVAINGGTSGATAGCPGSTFVLAESPPPPVVPPRLGLVLARESATVSSWLESLGLAHLTAVFERDGVCGEMGVFMLLIFFLFLFTKTVGPV